MLLDLFLPYWLLFKVLQLVDGVGVGINQREALDPAN